MTTYDATPDRGQPRDGGPTGFDVSDEHRDPTDSHVSDEPYLPEPPRPIELDAWVNWLRRTYGLPAAIIPPV